MFSNLPVMLQSQDFQARHSDMLAAAQKGVVYPKGTKVLNVPTFWYEPHVEQMLVEARRRFAECWIVRDWARDEPMLGQHDDFQWPAPVRPAIGANLRIRMPADYVVSDGPRRGMTRDDFRRAVEEACASPIPPPSSPL